VGHKSHAERFWGRWKDDMGLYEHTRLALETAENDDEKEALWRMLEEQLPQMTPAQQDDVLCAVADYEIDVPEHFQECVTDLLASEHWGAASAATCCLLSCGPSGMLRVMCALKNNELPHRAAVQGILSLHV